MSLEGWVYCDCVEKGRLTVPHPKPDLLTIADDGQPTVRSTSPEDFELHDGWVAKRPCPHYLFKLIHQSLGHVVSVERMGEIVTDLLDDPDHRPQGRTDPAVAVPVLWSKVLRPGPHCCDFVGTADVDRLRQELDGLEPLEGLGEEDAVLASRFISKLRGLVYASLWVGKPICF